MGRQVNSACRGIPSWRAARWMIPALFTLWCGFLVEQGCCDEADGKRLYELHCAGCHGAKGDGQGIAARFLYPRPRDFQSGRYRLVSSSNGVPTPADLDAVLVRGMPGSSMPPWPKLSDSERRAVVDYLLDFRKVAIRDREKADAEDAGEEFDEAATDSLIKDLTTPGEEVPVAVIVPEIKANLAHGKEVYAKGCASCHGKDGKGDGQEKMIDAEGYPTRPRDLTLGIYKGSPSYDSVYRRVLAGMPGTPMPASPKLTANEVGEVTRYVLSLSDEKQRAEIVLARHRVSATRVKNIPGFDSPEWKKIAPVALSMTPLWWRDQAVRAVNVQAAHDGKGLAVRLQWADSTADEHALHPDEFEDMAAIELFQGNVEPFLGMGATGAPIDLWQWRAAAKHAGESESLLDEYPFQTAIYESVVRGKNVPDFLTARAAGNLLMQVGSAAGLMAQGPGSLTFLPKASQRVNAEAAWSEGRWTVVMSRPMKVGAQEGVSVVPGSRVSFAAAIWDGAARDRAAQKSVTIWHDLLIE